MSSEHTEAYERPSRLKKILLGALVVGLALTGVGLIGHLSGAGWFGYRTWLYEGGELYLLNMSKQALYASVDGAPPVEVPAQNAQIVDLLGGTSVVEITDASGAPAGRYDVRVNRSDAFLKLTDEGCVAVVDVTPFYGGTQKDMLDFEAYLRKDARLWIPRSRNVIWPRKDFPAQLQGGEGKGYWFELVGCELLDEPVFLDAYLATRLDSRMAKALGKKK